MHGANTHMQYMCSSVKMLNAVNAVMLIRSFVCMLPTALNARHTKVHVYVEENSVWVD